MSAGLLQTVLALTLVLGLVLLLGWVMQRLAGPRRARALQVVSQVGLGQRERVVVVAWDGQEWMLGVGPGRVNLIAHRDAVPEEESPRGLGSYTAEANTPPSPHPGRPPLHAVGAQPPGRPAAPPERPTLPQAFALQLQQTLARWSDR